MRRRVVIAALVAVFMLTIEIALRLIWGAGDPLLLRADADVGYYFAANQDVVRRGNRMHINAYHQRSRDVRRNTPPGKTRLLMVGDSVTFGGTHVDQTETISADLERLLKAEAGEAHQVLNASAGSWGIGNQLAYLQEFGTFGSELVILQIGSHDLLQEKSSGEVVGHHPAMPNEKPWSAIGEVISLYVMPRIQAIFTNESVPPLTDRERAAAFKRNLAYFELAIKFIRGQGASVLVLHTPDRTEVNGDGSGDAVDYQPYRTRFLATAKIFDVPVIDLSREWRGASHVAQWFRDGVHLTAKGNKAKARALAQTITARKLL